MSDNEQSEAPPTAAGADSNSEEPDPLRNVLWIFLALLLVVAVGLAGLLVWVIAGRDDDSTNAGPNERAANYPIKDVRSIFGPDPGFKAPLGVSFSPDGNLWTSDTGNGRIVITTTAGRVKRVIADRTGPGAISTPYGIAADPERERMYVADWTRGAVLAFSQAGRFLESLPSPGQDPEVFGKDGFTPYDVKLVGSRVVASSNNGLYFFDSKGRVAAHWGRGKRGAGAGSFNFPDAFEVDGENGRVYVADSLNRRVVALDLDGNVLWVSGSPDAAGKTTGFWQLPRGITIAPDGTILVVDTFRFDDVGVGQGHVVALSSDGELISEFGRAGSEEDSFAYPDKIAVGPDGLYAIADRDHNRTLVFRLDELPPPRRSELSLYKKTFSRPQAVNVQHKV